ncbi:MAG: membrane dipeptidase, partial [Chloroflexi bacterium]|nr:membrane dipeptidase [Chloroflexota bacterium]
DPAHAHQAKLNDWDGVDYDGWGRIGVASGEEGPPLEALIDHFQRAIDLVGADHVGIGSDFDGVDAVPQEMEDIGKLPRITEELLARGYSDDQVTQVLGESNMRLFREAMD